MPRLKALPVLLALLTCTALVTFGQDPHLKEGPTQRLYSSSAFAHGYLHGYEMGYHYGDVDLQLAHSPQNVKSIRQFKLGEKLFKKDFGDKRTFVEGYQAGFRTGYADATEGSEFRAISNLRELTQELPQVDANANPILNDAITRGYVDGVKSGLNDGRAAADYRPDGSDCELALRFKEPPAKFFCSVYSLGYRFGYSDGFHNQHPQPVERRIAGEQ